MVWEVPRHERISGSETHQHILKTNKGALLVLLRPQSLCGYLVATQKRETERDGIRRATARDFAWGRDRGTGEGGEEREGGKTERERGEGGSRRERERMDGWRERGRERE